ncbi:hypothetical protein ERJ75_000069700 [Trypanosoma vivax]|nr:hypothetical protein ERJ75_000069700 [Trypanosoma vivax]
MRLSFAVFPGAHVPRTSSATGTRRISSHTGVARACHHRCSRLHLLPFLDVPRRLAVRSEGAARAVAGRPPAHKDVATRTAVAATPLCPALFAIAYALPLVQPRIAIRRTERALQRAQPTLHTKEMIRPLHPHPARTSGVFALARGAPSPNPRPSAGSSSLPLLCARCAAHHPRPSCSAARATTLRSQPKYSEVPEPNWRGGHSPSPSSAARIGTGSARLSSAMRCARGIRYVSKALCVSYRACRSKPVTASAAHTACDYGFALPCSAARPGAPFPGTSQRENAKRKRTGTRSHTMHRTRSDVRRVTAPSSAAEQAFSNDEPTDATNLTPCRLLRPMAPTGLLSPAPQRRTFRTLAKINRPHAAHRLFITPAPRTHQSTRTQDIKHHRPSRPHLLAMASEPPHPLHGAGFLFLRWRACLQCTQRGAALHSLMRTKRLDGKMGSVSFVCRGPCPTDECGVPFPCGVSSVCRPCPRPEDGVIVVGLPGLPLRNARHARPHPRQRLSMRWRGTEPSRFSAVSDRVPDKR